MSEKILLSQVLRNERILPDRSTVVPPVSPDENPELLTWNFSLRLNLMLQLIVNASISVSQPLIFYDGNGICVRLKPNRTSEERT
jgi:hypothetical protein